MEKWLTDQVRARANNRCEYCRMAIWLYGEPFHIDHIISRKHGGLTELLNLALCCLDCNLHKGSDIAGLDPRHGGLTRLFNPRSDTWEAHFQWNGPVLEGLTEVGRTTVRVLQINQPIRVRARRELIAEGVFP